MSLKPLLSIVTPTYNEEQNLPVLYEELKKSLLPVEDRYRWEWIMVDDHSVDNGYQVFREWAAQDDRLKGVRLSRNCGAHDAVKAGLQECTGDFAVVMAADLQDPPAVIPQLLEEQEKGSQIVWAVRSQRKGVKISTLVFSRLYYWMMRRFLGVQLPPMGADFFLIERLVIEGFLQFKEHNVDIHTVLCSMGFRQSYIPCVKEARLHGTSGWTFSRKLKVVVDSITAFTFAPIRAMVYVGFLTALLGFSYGALIVTRYFHGTPVQGWSSLMVVILFLGGMQMCMLGTLGEYTWRTLDESRARPRYFIEDRTPHRHPEAP